MQSCDSDTVNSQRVALGESIVIGMNECVEVTRLSGSDGNTILDVCLVQVEDQRCLKSHCETCFGSFASTVLQVSAGVNEHHVLLPIVGCVEVLSCGQQDNVIDTLGYRFCLQTLLPYPDSSNVPVSQSQYEATIIVLEL